MTAKTRIATIIFVILFSIGCSYIAPYNQHAYQQATSLKVEAMLLVEKGDEPYNNHKEEIEEFKLKMLKAHEYVSGIPKNSETAKQWAILIDPDGNSMFGFLNLWEKETTVSNVFIKEFKKEIEKHFNAIIELEAGKIGSNQ